MKIDVIALAREAGFRTGRYTQPVPLGLPFIESINNGCLVELERFFQLVQQATAEECAKLCDSRHVGDNNREDAEARRCADAIRAKFSDKDAK